MAERNEPHHDHSYKRLFAHREMVRDLLLGFVPQPWIADADLGSLTPVSGSFVTDDFRDREDDCIWRLRLGGEWLYVYLLIEFQSAIERYMAVRIGAYLMLLYQDLIEAKQLGPEGKLPPVLPILLYNGEARWSAARELDDLLEASPAGLEGFRPRLSYLVLDEGAIVNDPNLDPEVRNLVAALFQLEHARDEATWLRVYQRLIALLDSQALRSLKRAFGFWIYKSYIKKKRPGIRLPDIDDHHEVHAMLQDRVEQWNRELVDKGRKDGVREGESRFLKRQLTRRFGPLPAWAEARIAEATEPELEAWTDAVLEARTLTEVLGPEPASH